MSKRKATVPRSLQTILDRAIEVHPETGCWIWKRTTNSNGYGSVTWQGDKLSAHRWVYEHYRGAIPEGLVLDHLCSNKRCCNPEHLEPVTLSENSRRGGSHTKVLRRAAESPHQPRLFTVPSLLPWPSPQPEAIQPSPQWWAS